MKILLKLDIKIYSKAVLLPFAKNININQKSDRNYSGSKN